jgi:hypothetical protein
MPAHRLPQRHRLLLLVTLLSVILTPLGSALATPAQDAHQAPIAQDGTEVPEDKSPNDPPQDAKPTEAPNETKEPPLENKPTEIPPTDPVETEQVQTEPVETREPPGTEPAPTEQPATEPAPSEPSEPGILPVTSTITVLSGICDDPAYNPYSVVDPGDLLTNCIPSFGNSTFTYEQTATGGPGGLSLTQITSAGVTDFNVPAGNFSLRQHLPSGSGAPVVACESATIGAYPIFFPGSGATINSHIDSGDTLTCYWFNVTVASTTITIIKGTCDYPTDPTSFRPVDASSLAELLANCTPYNTDVSFTYTYSDTGATLTQTTSGSTTSFDVQPGSFSMQEHVPPNHGSSVVGCQSTIITDYPVFVPGNGSTIRTHIDYGDTLTCYWFNTPIPPTTITLVKGLCDAAGFDPYSASPDELAANCTQSSGDATITYRQMYTGDPASELTFSQTTTGSITTFEIPPGNFQIREDIPEGFGEPVVACHLHYYGIDLLMRVDVDTIGHHSDSGHTTTCHWYNVVPGPTSHLTIHKWECPPGYDHTAPSADPTEDCDQPLNGVAFHIEGDNGHFAAETTGDSEPGSLTFTNLEPAGYTVTEALPAGYDASFVWSCTTAGLPASPTTPMSTGVTLTITTVTGWNTTCHWFNVRETTPPGSLTVIKYACGPATWLPLAPCSIHRKGQDFDLIQWIDGAWVSFGIGTTDRSGRYTWIDLPPGKYALDEIGRDWCRITSDNMTPGGTAISVEPGQEAVVHVYNCATSKPISPPVRVVSLLALLLRDIWNPAP